MHVVWGWEVSTDWQGICKAVQCSDGMGRTCGGHKVLSKTYQQHLDICAYGNWLSFLCGGFFCSVGFFMVIQALGGTM